MKTDQLMTTTLTNNVIYVAEDNIDLREYAEMVLVKAGFIVKVFEDGKLTLDALLNEKPALLLTDINMPIMNGHELVRSIRHHKEYNDMRIVIYSSEEDVIDYQEDKSLQTVSLRKPAKADVLISLISKLIQKDMNM